MSLNHNSSSQRTTTEKNTEHRIINKYIEADITLAISVIIQVLGIYLIVTCLVMFAKKRSLRKPDHLLLVNILVSGTGFLLVDWLLFLPRDLACDMFTYLFIVLGTVGTYTSTGIALNRFHTMVRTSLSISNQKHVAMLVFCVWLPGIAIIMYPICKKLAAMLGTWGHPHVSSINGRPTICLFEAGLLYENAVIGLVFASLVVLAPMLVMLFCYTKIYLYIKKVRINRWINAALEERGRSSHIIQRKGRKANVFEMRSTAVLTHSQSQNRLHHCSTSREKKIIRKGVIALGIVFFSWVPVTAVIVYISFVGFNSYYIPYLKYVLLNVKVVVVLDVLFYICLNEMYRKSYISLIIKPIKQRVIRSKDADTRIADSISYIQTGAFQSNQGSAQPHILPLQTIREHTTINSAVASTFASTENTVRGQGQSIREHTSSNIAVASTVVSTENMVRGQGQSIREHTSSNIAVASTVVSTENMVRGQGQSIREHTSSNSAVASTFASTENTVRGQGQSITEHTSSNIAVASTVISTENMVRGQGHSIREHTTSNIAVASTSVSTEDTVGGQAPANSTVDAPKSWKKVRESIMSSPFSFFRKMKHSKSMPIILRARRCRVDVVLPRGVSLADGKIGT